MANLNLKFLRGAQASLPTSGTDGYFYLTTDTHRLYTSIDGKVVPVNEGVTTVANLDALAAVTGAQAGDFFYCTEENILTVFNGQKFVQINPDTGVTSVEVVGAGNAVTDASYDPATRKLTLTKGETFATQAYVGNIPNDENGSPVAASVVAYIDKKTEGIATDENLNKLAERVTTAEGEIDALQADSHTHTFADSDVEDAIAKKHAHTFVDSDVEDAISKKHAHTFNETELNKIVEGDVAKWNGVAADHLTSADKTTLENAIKEAKKAGTDANTNIETYKVTNDARVLAVEEDIAEIIDGTNGILAQAKSYSDGKLATARTEISAEIDADVKVVADDLAGYKTSNDTALAGVKATAEAAATKVYTDEELAKKVDKVTGKSLVDDAEITKLAGVSEGANKVEASENNGKIKIDGVETTVYTHPEKHAIADVDGLGDALAGFQVKGDYAAEEHKHVKADITDFAHTHVASEITDLDATIKGYDYATKTEAQGYADAKDEAIKAAKDAADAAQDEVDALETYVGTFTASEGVDTVVKYIDAKTANIASDERVDGIENRVKAIEDDYLVEADKTELAGLITAEKERAEGIEGGLETRLAAVEGDYLKAADKTELEGKITAEENRAKGVEESLQTQINTIMSNPDAEGAINSINEFTQYVKDHGTIADGFRTDIDKNKEDIAAATKAIADQATSDAATYETKTDASAKLTEAKGYTDTEVTKDRARLDVLEAIDHEAYKAADEVLAESIATAKTDMANQDAVVLAEAQSYADQAKADAIAEAEGKVNTLSGNVYTKDQTYTQAEVDALLEAAQSWGEF